MLVTVDCLDSINIKSSIRSGMIVNSFVRNNNTPKGQCIYKCEWGVMAPSLNQPRKQTPARLITVYFML